MLTEPSFTGPAGLASSSASAFSSAFASGLPSAPAAGLAASLLSGLASPSAALVSVFASPALASPSAPHAGAKAAASANASNDRRVVGSLVQAFMACSSCEEARRRVGRRRVVAAVHLGVAVRAAAPLPDVDHVLAVAVGRDGRRRLARRRRREHAALP